MPKRCYKKEKIAKSKFSTILFLMEGNDSQRSQILSVTTTSSPAFILLEPSYPPQFSGFLNNMIKAAKGSALENSRVAITSLLLYGLNTCSGGFVIFDSRNGEELASKLVIREILESFLFIESERICSWDCSAVLRSCKAPWR